MSDFGLVDAETTGPGRGDFPPGRFVASVVSVFAHLGVATLLVAIVLTCGDIAWRRIVGGAFVDTYDITKLCLVAAASWSIPYGFSQGTHVTVDLLAARFPARAQALLELAISLATAALLAFLTWLTWQGAALRYAYGDTTQNLQIPLVLYWAIFLVGLVLAIAAALAKAAEAGIALRRGEVSP